MIVNYCFGGEFQREGFLTPWCYVGRENLLHGTSLTEENTHVQPNMASSAVLDGAVGQGLCYLHTRKFLLKTFRHSVFVTRVENHKKYGRADGQNLKTLLL